MWEKVEIVTKKTRSKSPESGLSLREASEIMGSEHFFGPDALRNAFGVNVEAPVIPFTTQELHEARARGEMLILRTDKVADNSPLTMKKMYEYCQTAFQSKGKILAAVDWYKNEPFYTQEACRASWALVSKEVLPTSTNKNYLQQTDEIVAHLQNEVYKTGLPAVYKDAIDEYMNERPIIEPLIQSNWQLAAEKLEKLQITKLTRQSATEVLSDLLVAFFNTNDERLLEKIWTWTATRGSVGSLVRVGFFGTVGAFVSGWSPDRTYSDIGVLLSRRG